VREAAPGIADSLRSGLPEIFGAGSAFDKATEGLRAFGRLDMAKVVDEWRTLPGQLSEVQPGVFAHSTAYLDEEAVLKPGAIIGPHAAVHAAEVAGILDSRVTVADGAKVMENAYLGPNLSVHPGGVIGSATRIFSDKTSLEASFGFDKFPIKPVPMDVRFNSKGESVFVRLLPGEKFRDPGVINPEIPGLLGSK
jgi:hypothetical protein